MSLHCWTVGILGNLSKTIMMVVFDSTYCTTPFPELKGLFLLPMKFEHDCCQSNTFCVLSLRFSSMLVMNLMQLQTLLDFWPEKYWFLSRNEDLHMTTLQFTTASTSIYNSVLFVFLTDWFSSDRVTASFVDYFLVLQKKCNRKFPLDYTTSRANTKYVYRPLFFGNIALSLINSKSGACNRELCLGHAQHLWEPIAFKMPNCNYFVNRNTSTACMFNAIIQCR